MTETGQSRRHSGRVMILVVILALTGATVYGARLVAKPGKERSASQLDADIAAQGKTNAAIVRVYYFHRTVRCLSCEKLESLAQKAVEEGFAEELLADSVQWRTVNLDQPENEHYESDYALQMQSVVVSESRGGKEVRWKNLDKVWDLLDDDSGLLGYVQDEIREFVQKG